MPLVPLLLLVFVLLLLLFVVGVLLLAVPLPLPVVPLPLLPSLGELDLKAAVAKAALFGLLPLVPAGGLPVRLWTV